ncbi:MAG TPA: TusE/DsrC/DsvC family sulfur relay protein [Gammaproteobacteria bacterium]|nr:TusE/DsrC/DsvC family sulfur relay protein [Gammaproteobacteria bacterium]
MREPIELPVERDSDGFLMDPDDWNPDIARQLASEWGHFELTDEHFEIIDFMRAFFDEHRIVADVRDVTKYLTKHRGMEKKAGKQYLFELFPHGYMQQGCQIAGMRRPRAWSVG